MPMTLRFSDTDIESPTWEQVEEAIKSLDGKNHTTVSLGDFRKENYLGIGGGGGDVERKYIIFVTYRNLDCYTLIAPDGTDEDRKLIVGGQAVSYRDKECHSLDMALHVGKVYLETGDRDPSMTWEHS